MQHTLFYDADCPLCQRAMARARAANRSGSLALRLMYRECEGHRLHRIWNWPLLRPLADWGYPLLARHRYRFSRWFLPHATCDSGTCYRPTRRKP